MKKKEEEPKIPMEEPKIPLEVPMAPGKPPFPVIPLDDSMWPLTGTPMIRTDPQGSWTGRPENLSEVPVQDADDL